MPLVWVATTAIALGSGSNFAPAYNAGDIVPDSVVATFSLDGTGLVGQVTIEDDGTVTGYSGVDPVTQAELEAALASLPSAAVTSVNAQIGDVVLDAAAVGAAAASHTHAQADVTGLTAALAGKIASTEKAAANGVATLDSGGKIPQAQIPAVALTDFLGAVASQAAMLALTGQRGDWATRTDLGTDWQLIADDPTLLASWRQMTYPASPVSSVAGRTGAVTLSAADITNSTTIGRNLLTAATQAAARSEIGAGTSDLALGTTSTTAAAGNHTHTAAAVGAVEAVTAGLKARVMTQAAYDALGTKDATTLYLIQG